MKAKKVQMIMAFALIGVVVFALLRPRHRTLAPIWNQYAKFLREADTVQTIATTYDSFPYDEVPDDVEKFFHDKAPKEQTKIQLCDKAMREKVLDCIAQSTSQEGSRASCFDPHHFVIAKKGSETVVLSLCYTCGLCSVTGAIEMSDSIFPNSMGKATEAFGIDIDRLMVEKSHRLNPDR